jgi:hypothetical protein
MLPFYYPDNDIIRKYIEIETHRIHSLDDLNDIKLYLPKELSIVRCYFKYMNFGRQIIGFHPSYELILWLREYIGIEHWRYGNEKYVPEEVGYYYFSRINDLRFGYQHCQPFLLFSQAQHATLYKLTWG